MTPCKGYSPDSSMNFMLVHLRWSCSSWRCLFLWLSEDCCETFWFCPYGLSQLMQLQFGWQLFSFFTRTTWRIPLIWGAVMSLSVFTIMASSTSTHSFCCTDRVGVNAGACSCTGRVLKWFPFTILICGHLIRHCKTEVSWSNMQKSKVHWLHIFQHMSWMNCNMWPAIFWSKWNSYSLSCYIIMYLLSLSNLLSLHESFNIHIVIIIHL